MVSALISTQCKDRAVLVVDVPCLGQLADDLVLDHVHEFRQIRGTRRCGSRSLSGAHEPPNAPNGGA